MPTTYSNVESKLEQAAVTYLNALAVPPTAQIVTGKASADKPLPLVVCEASAATEDPPFTGNYWIDFSAIVKTSATVDTDGVDPKPADDLLVGIVFNAFQASDLAAQLSASLPDFTCIGVKDYAQDSTFTGNAWENTIKFRAWCCGSTLTP